MLPAGLLRQAEASRSATLRLLLEIALVLTALLVGLAVGHQTGWSPQRCLQQHAGRYGQPVPEERGSILPLWDHNQAEAVFHASQQTALQFLEEHPKLRINIDIWYLLGPFYSCPNRQRIGRPIDGGKWLCNPRQLLLHQDCTIYSVGSNGEVSFEKAMLAQFPNCAMHTFDPTLSFKHNLKVQTTKGVTFHKQGITSEQGLEAAATDFPGKKFTTLARSMAEIGLDWLDVLKIDIEGGEWEVFLELLDEGAAMPFTQILLEVHTNMIEGGAARQQKVLRRFFPGLYRAGYRVFSVEPNYLAPTQCLEFAFVKVDASGYFIRAP